MSTPRRTSSGGKSAVAAKAVKTPAKAPLPSPKSEQKTRPAVKKAATADAPVEPSQPTKPMPPAPAPQKILGVTAALLAIGDEVLTGEIANANAAFLATRLSELGL